MQLRLNEYLAHFLSSIFLHHCHFSKMIPKYYFLYKKCNIDGNLSILVTLNTVVFCNDRRKIHSILIRRQEQTQKERFFGKSCRLNRLI